MAEAEKTSKFVTVEGAAEMLGLRPATIRQWVWRRQIEVVRVGRSVRIRRAALDALVARGTTPALERRGEAE